MCRNIPLGWKSCLGTSSVKFFKSSKILFYICPWAVSHVFGRLYTSLSSPMLLCCNICVAEDVVWSCCWVGLPGQCATALIPIPGLAHQKYSHWCRKLTKYPFLLLSCSACSQWNFIKINDCFFCVVFIWVRWTSYTAEQTAVRGMALCVFGALETAWIVSALLCSGLVWHLGIAAGIDFEVMVWRSPW